MSLVKDLSMLREANSEDEISSLSASLLTYFSESEKNARSVALNVVNKVRGDRRMRKFSEISSSDFFQVRTSVYDDGRGRRAASLGLVFVQDYQSFDAKLDEKVSRVLQEIIFRENLHEVFRDVVVNSVQYVDGNRV